MTMIAGTITSIAVDDSATVTVTGTGLAAALAASRMATLRTFLLSPAVTAGQLRLLAVAAASGMDLVVLQPLPNAVQGLKDAAPNISSNSVGDATAIVSYIQAAAVAVAPKDCMGSGTPGAEVDLAIT